MGETSRTAKWDRRFLELAYQIGLWSKDRSTRVGAVIVGPDLEIRSTGYNGFPRGVNDDVDERHERPQKYLWTEHAERNAIYNAARFGTPLKGCTLYLMWFPCADCARAIVQVGITNLVSMRVPDWDHERWGTSFRCADTILREGGVAIRFGEDLE